MSDFKECFDKYGKCEKDRQNVSYELQSCINKKFNENPTLNCNTFYSDTNCFLIPDKCKSPSQINKELQIQYIIYFMYIVFSLIFISVISIIFNIMKMPKQLNIILCILLSCLFIYKFYQNLQTNQW
jgi:hypothetical protein